MKSEQPLTRVFLAETATGGLYCSFSTCPHMLLDRMNSAAKPNKFTKCNRPFVLKWKSEAMPVCEAKTLRSVIRSRPAEEKREMVKKQTWRIHRNTEVEVLRARTV